ncbi:M23 family metallopeptidase [Candidatus Palauibacter sp.]|uniref:M23 family metallopeptidase n=1 Tax=Candidatus Palauibacter sp. TaxID=3101350 RepID=UPI003AF276AE
MSTATSLLERITPGFLDLKPALTRLAASGVLASAAALAIGCEPPPPPPLPPLEVSWAPAEPVQGHLFLIRATFPPGSGIASATGSAGGETLRFHRVDSRAASDGGGSSDTRGPGDPGAPADAPESATSADSVATILESLAAVPIDATDTVDAWVTATYEDGRTQTDSLRIPVLEGEYEHERLTVAPRFGSPPNEEDQVRLRRDRFKAGWVAGGAHATPRLWGSEVRRPRDSRVTSAFGTGREFNGQISSRHMGLDLAGRWGDTVTAAADGVVALVDEFLLAGNIVYLNHGGGLLSGYFHLSQQLVETGQHVPAGTPIGLVGATGRVTGPHLHWVVRYGTTSVAPRSWLALPP